MGQIFVAFLEYMNFNGRLMILCEFNDLLMPTYLILAQYAVCEDPVEPGQSLSISNTCCEEFQINLDFCEEDFSNFGFRYVLFRGFFTISTKFHVSIFFSYFILF